jgi:hypothetical protein
VLTGPLAQAQLVEAGQAALMEVSGGSPGKSRSARAQSVSEEGENAF